MRLLCARLLVAASFACTRGAPPEPPPLERPADHSLAGPALAERGLPDPSRPWGPAEYEEAARVLGQLAGEDPLLLPQQGSPRCGAVFARLTDCRPLGPLRAAAGTEALTQLSRINEQVLVIQRLYVDATKSLGRTFGPELLELLNLLFCLADESTAEGAAMVARLPNAEVAAEEGVPDLERLRHGYRQMQDAVTLELLGAVRSFAERQVYREADRLRLSESLAAHLPRLLLRLRPEQQPVFGAILRERQQEEPAAAVRKALGALAAAVEKPARP